MGHWVLKEHIQLRIDLKGSNPKIWRRVIVDNTISFNELHLIIQKAMGWENCHLYGFQINDTFLSDSSFELEESEDSFDYSLNELLKKNMKFRYIYDFGDNWIHIIKVEKICEVDEKIKVPIVVKGESACPFEDIGGIYEYLELLDAYKNKNHLNYETYSDFIEDIENFNPKEFSVDESNKRLMELR